MSRTVKPSTSSDTLKPLRTKVQTLRRQVPDLAEDDIWREWLVKVAGIASTRAMKEAQLHNVVAGLHKAGAPRLPQASRSRYADTAQMTMIRGLWLELADLAIVQDRSEAALAAFVRRQTRQDVGRLTPQSAAGVIEALKSWRARLQPAPPEVSVL